MLGKIELRVLDVTIRTLDDNRDVILMDVILPNPQGSSMSTNSARFLMYTQSGAGESYYKDNILPLIK